MQVMDERQYRATRAQIHIFRRVLDGLEAHPDDDLPETLRNRRAESVRGQLHDLESELTRSIIRLAQAPVSARQRLS